MSAPAFESTSRLLMLACGSSSGRIQRYIQRGSGVGKADIRLMIRIMSAIAAALLTGTAYTSAAPGKAGVRRLRTVAHRHRQPLAHSEQ